MSLRILHVEDSPTDAKLILQELRRSEAVIEHRRVENADALRLALDEGGWDVILCDWALPRFNALGALAIVREKAIDVPFIIVSGTIGEEAAVEAMRSGARDYVLKDKLARLPPVIEREIRERNLRVEQAKRRAEDERFFNLSLDVLCIVGFDGYFKRVNPAWHALLGWSVEELLATPWIDFVHPEDRQATLAVSTKRSATGIGARELENRLRCKDGSFRSLVWTSVSFAEEQIIYAAAHDITARKRLEEQIRQSQKMEAIGSLAGGIAHDFNNLLSVILSYTSLLLDDLQPSDPMRADIEEVSRAGLRATDLTRQLLAFSRQQMLEPQVIDLNRIVAGLEKMLRRVLREDVELSIQPGLALGRVHADPGQIEQVILNLAVNALDAMPQGGKLTIQTANVDLDAAYAAEHQGIVPGPHVMLTVTDDGTGMDAATRARVFEPFFTTKEQGKGTGLGLATVFGVVQQSHGEVLVESEPGKGTTFKIFLPRTEHPEARPTVAPAPSTGLRGSETVLLVEDEEQVRLVMRNILCRSGYNVLDAPNGGEGIRLCEQHPGVIHLLLTDIVMPGLSGRQLADRLSALRPGLKVLYMSGYTDDTIVHHGVVDAGIAFLQKPLTPDALLRKVRAVLDS